MQGKSLLSTERLPARNSAERAPCFRYLRSESKLLIFERLVSYCFRLIRGQTQPHLQHKITLTCRNRNTPSLLLNIEPEMIFVKHFFHHSCRQRLRAKSAMACRTRVLTRTACRDTTGTSTMTNAQNITWHASSAPRPLPGTNGRCPEHAGAELPDCRHRRDNRTPHRGHREAGCPPVASFPVDRPRAPRMWNSTNTATARNLAII